MRRDARLGEAESTLLRGFTVIELMIVLAIVGALSAVALPVYHGYVERREKTAAIRDINVLEVAIDRFRTEFGVLPPNLDVVAEPGLLDPWGNPYEYLNLETAPANEARKDKKLHPLNSDYDLYSRGKDGKTQKPLTAHDSWDDIIRANDGAYIGLASEY